jgi:hypothetical protein
LVAYAFAAVLDYDDDNTLFFAVTTFFFPVIVLPLPFAATGVARTRLKVLKRQASWPLGASSA